MPSRERKEGRVSPLPEDMLGKLRCAGESADVALEPALPVEFFIRYDVFHAPKSAVQVVEGSFEPLKGFVFRSGIGIIELPFLLPPKGTTGSGLSSNAATR